MTAVGTRIIDFRRGAKLYFQRGSYYYCRNKLEQALACYRRAVAVDPGNPVNHFNLACLLTEMGKYQESISLLHSVTQMDGDLNESWFWLALNHGQLRQYREAGRCLREYLEREPYGDYSWQAEEILHFLRSELPMLDPEQRSIIENLCLRGIELASQGLLEEAAKLFAEASSLEPELSAPKNNLALTLFYLGEVDRALAVCREILEIHPENVYANCNLALFYQILGDQLAVRRQIDVLDGIWGDDPDDMMKLGTTYGLLGQDRKAYAVFSHMRSLGVNSFALLLLLGVSACNCGYRAKALQIFDAINAAEPDNPYRAYRDFCAEATGCKLPYSMRIPNPVLALALEDEGMGAEQELKKARNLWPQLLWIVRNGGAAVRGRALRVIKHLNHQPLTRLVSACVWDDQIDFRCRSDIFAVLTQMGVPVWKERYWNRGRFSKNRAVVLETALEYLYNHGCGFAALHGTYMAWQFFCRKSKAPVRNTALWSAALIALQQGRESWPALSARFGLRGEELRQVLSRLSCYSII